jgi:hypothetical protein
MAIPKPTKEHREPIPAPFAAGTKLRYLGPPRLVGIFGEKRVVTAGSEHVVAHAHDGFRGGMWPNALDDGYGPAWIERDTIDGCSTIEFDPMPGDYGHLVNGKRIINIFESDRKLWEVVA